MLEALGVGVVARRTGDIWQGAPGCSLTATVQMKTEKPEITEKVVRAFVNGTRYVHDNPKESAEIAHRYIGINARFIQQALQRNHPNVDAIRNQDAMDHILSLMMKLGYIQKKPSDYTDLTFLDKVASSAKR